MHHEGAPSYFLNLFKIEGHKTYRCHIATGKDVFEQQILNSGSTRVTEVKQFAVNRLTGDIILVA